MHVLILGGTTEARELAVALTGAGVRVTTSLAGRVSRPAALPGEVRVGGFGGAAGLADWLRAHPVDAVVDATHPFAARITANASRATTQTAVPLLLLSRPGWRATPDDRWHDTPSLQEAATLLPTLGTRALLTTGRLGLAAFAEITDVHLLIRTVEPPDLPLPPNSETLLARGPFTLENELTLLRTHRIDVLVTKDSGGTATSPKLTAARDLGLPVIVVRRPPAPEGAAVTGEVGGALEWLGALS